VKNKVLVPHQVAPPSMTGGDLRDAKVKLTQKKRKELVSYGSSSVQD